MQVVSWKLLRHGADHMTEFDAHSARVKAAPAGKGNVPVLTGRG